MSKPLSGSAVVHGLDLGTQCLGPGLEGYCLGLDLGTYCLGPITDCYQHLSFSLIRFLHNVAVVTCVLVVKALDVDRCVGAIVCKLHIYQDSLIRGYIAMLAVDKEYRRQGIGKYQ